MTLNIAPINPGIQLVVCKESKMNIKYRVTPTTDERNGLKQLINHGRTAGYRIKHAQSLLALHEIAENAQWTDKKIAYAIDAVKKPRGFAQTICGTRP